MSDRYVFEDEASPRYVFETASDFSGGNNSLSDQVRGGAAEPRGVGQIVLDNLKATPGRMVSGAMDTARGVLDTIAPSDENGFPTSGLPKMSTTLPLVLGGPGSTVVKRLAAFAAGKVLDEPKATPMENAETAAKGVFGDWRNPMSMLLSPAAMETYFPLGGKLLRSTPGAKAAINEGQAQELADTMGATNRATRAPIQTARESMSPYQEAPLTPPAIRRATESGAIESAAGDRFDRVLDKVATAAGNPVVNGPELQRAYGMMPQLERDKLIGAVSPQGFTLQQAQSIRSWIGGPAFAMAPLGQGVRAATKQLLWKDITGEMEGALAGSPRALQLWRTNNTTFAGTEALQEALTSPRAFTSQPNRMFLNRSTLSEYLASNEKDMVRRMGQSAYDQLVQRVLSGAQPGTRDALVGGSGSALEALRQTYGEGRGGAPQIAGSLLRTGLPNVGSAYTGQRPYSLPSPAIQTLLDLAAQGGER